MKCIILAGGRGERLSEETSYRPKPLVEVGGMPILWHIMKSYSYFGINDFIICCGYKGYLIKDFFANYFLHTSDVTINLKENTMKIHNQRTEPWQVTLVDTGLHTMTGGRLKLVEPYVENDTDLCFTYGDGVSDINIRQLIQSHTESGLLATISAVKPPGRFGSIQLESGRAINFTEKPPGDGGFINGGFFVLKSQVIRKLNNDPSLIWENQPLRELAKSRQLNAFIHNGFWHPMDTLRDKNYLDGLWLTGDAPWALWKNDK